MCILPWYYKETREVSLGNNRVSPPPSNRWPRLWVILLIWEPLQSKHFSEMFWERDAKKQFPLHNNNNITNNNNNNSNWMNIIHWKKKELYCCIELENGEDFNTAPITRNCEKWLIANYTYVTVWMYPLTLKWLFGWSKVICQLWQWGKVLFFFFKQIQSQATQISPYPIVLSSTENVVKSVCL